jgi:Pentapeptide repeats (8 copies)
MLKRWAAWPQGIRWLVGIAAVVLWLAIAWAMFVPVADWLAYHDVGSIKGPQHETALDNARGRLLTLAAGVAAAGALVFTALNFNLLRRNSEKTDQWQRRTHELAEQGQVTERYTKAIEQLGSDKLDVRIGGIYALERVARDSARDHPTVMEVLMTFVREHSPEPWPLQAPDGAEPERSTRPDIQAAVTVLGRRDVEHDDRNVNLYGANLTRARLARANLAGANLMAANLAGATLYSANLTGAELTGTHLTGARLRRANLTRADLDRADLTGAHLGRADLTGAHLGRADLTGARWPEGTPVPDGWKLDTGSGRLERASTGSEPTGAN